MRAVIACIQFHCPVGQVQIEFSAGAKALQIASEWHLQQMTHLLVRRHCDSLLLLLPFVAYFNPST